MFEHWLEEALPDEGGVLPAGGSLSGRRRVVLELELPGHGLEFAVTALAGADLLRALTAAAEGCRLSPDELLWAARGWQKLIGFAQAQQHQVLGWFALAAMPAGFRDDLVARSVGEPSSPCSRYRRTSRPTPTPTPTQAIRALPPWTPPGGNGRARRGCWGRRTVRRMRSRWSWVARCGRRRCCWGVRGAVDEPAGHLAGVGGRADQRAGGPGGRDRV
jgi:hypothetical protein